MIREGALQIGPFAERHLRPAAELLAAHYPSNVEFSDAPTARRFVDAWYGSGPAMAAERNGELVGFLAATLPKTPGDPLAKIRPEQHCAVPEDRRRIYRGLYGALSGRLISVGAFHHMITVATAHTEAIEALFQIEFGIDQIKGRRRPGGQPDRAPEVRPARRADIPALIDLAIGVTLFHAEPPMLRPALGDFAQIRDSYLTALDADRELVLVAEHDGRPVGVMQAGPDRRYRNTATIGLAGVAPSARSRGVGSALVAGVLDWAHTRGFEACGVEWTSANPISDPFWRGHGFDPVHYKLIRRVDQRIAWADATLSYEHFTPEDVPSVGLEPTL